MKHCSVSFGRNSSPFSSNMVTAAASFGLLLALVAAGWPLPSAAQNNDEQLVDCLFPSQVRRLGASSTTVTPRRQAKATVSECRKAGGEYIEPAGAPVVVASNDDLKLWLPLAAAGVALAQVTAGELYDKAGDFTNAALWYNRAAAQGNARAQFNLAALAEQGRGVERDVQRAQRLVAAAAGIALWGGLDKERPHIELVDPKAVLKRPQTSASNEFSVDTSVGDTVVTGKAESTVGIDKVTVNGDVRRLDANGLFSVPVALSSDPLKLQITAVDKMGTSATVDYVLTRSASPSLVPQPPVALLTPISDNFVGKRWALVIANQNYQRWEVLDTPLADGKAIGETLRSRFGFDVTLLTNATRQSTLAALSQLRSKAGPDDQIIIYYAGHGQMDPATSRGYWIPVDGDRRDQSNWVSVIDVTDQLSAVQAKHVWVIADSCYSGTLAGNLASRVDSALSTEQRQKTLQQLSNRRARVAFTSGGFEPVIDGGGGVHSLFARSLLDVLNQVAAPVGARELASTVSARFSLSGKALKITQQPSYAPIAFAGHEAGDFVLTPQQQVASNETVR
jgi:uncharacterized protein